MAQIVLGVAGAVVGFYVGGPTGAQVGFAAGSAIGGYVDTVNRKIEGPKLNDLRFVGTEYGEPIPYLLAGPRVSGQIWYASEKRPVAHESGGKGGEPQVTTFTYEIDLLVGLSTNEITGVGREWWNGKLVYYGFDRTDLWRRRTVYTGDSAQMPDPTYEAAVGAANAPAYRGRGYVFYEGLQLDASGQLPLLTYEANTYGEVTPTSVATQLAIGAGISGFLSTAYDEAATSTAGFGVGTAYLAAFRISPDVPAAGTGISVQVYVSVAGATVWSDILTLDGVSATQVLRHQITISGHDATLVRVGFVMSAGLAASANYYLLAVAGATVYAPVSNAADVAPGGEYFGIVTDGANPYRFADYSNALFGGAIWGTSAPVPSLVDASITLQSAVGLLCSRAGLAAGDIDASALSAITQPVRGLAISQIEPIRGVMDQLREAYLFDATLTDKIVFLPRGAALVRTLAYSEIGAGQDTAQDDPLQITVGNDLELPAQVVVGYRNASNDYQVATEYSDRLVLSSQVAAQPVQFALGLDPAEAKKAADAIVYDAHAALVRTQFSTTLAHAALQPTDVVGVTDRAGRVMRLRIQRRTDDGAVLTFSAVRDEASAIVSSALTDTGYTEQTTVTVRSATVLRFLDIPLLRDEDDGAGHYVATRGAGTNWGGAEVYSSVNNVDFSNVVTVRESAVLGSCTTTLATFAPGSALIDLANTVTVTVAHGTLSSSTEAAMFADGTINVMQVGSETIRFVTATATDTDPNVYVLSRLFRGQRGTEWAIDGHAAGESCCLLRPRGLRRIESPAIGATRYLKGVTFGLAPADVAAVAYANTGISSKPWAPVNVQQAKSGSDYTITWDRRSRLATRFASASGINVPLGEESERYQVDLYNGGTLVATYSVTSPSAAFTGAYTGHTVTVYQLSGVVGRGYASAALTLY